MGDPPARRILHESIGEFPGRVSGRTSPAISPRTEQSKMRSFYPVRGQGVSFRNASIHGVDWPQKWQ
jgi:hypothetical protein